MPKEIKAHTCDFCNGMHRYLRHAVTHEKKCRSNPNNHHQCLKHCKHLHVYEETEVIHSIVVHDGWDEHREDDGPTYTYFECKFHKGMQLYSYKLEAKKAGFEHFVANWGEDGVMRMPLECPHYEDKNPDWNKENEAESTNSGNSSDLPY